MKVVKIISGGQTGADRGGLDYAIEAGVPHGGYCPRDRRAEDLRIPDRYNMEEMTSREYPPRTGRNVKESDFTVIVVNPLTGGGDSPGTRLTLQFCKYYNKLYCIIMTDVSLSLAADVLRLNLSRMDKPEIVLNVAGNRESVSPGIQKWTADMLRIALS